MKKKLNLNYSTSMFDIIEIFFKNIIKIIIITASVFIILILLNNFLINQKETYAGTIKIFPTDNTYLLNEINRYAELRNEKRNEFITQKDIQSSSKEQNVIDKRSKIKNTEYLTPTRLIWDFSDIVQKKFLADKNISSVMVKSTNHNYFANHLSYLTINFKFNDFNDDKFNQVNILLDETILESKNKMKDFTKILMSEILVLFDLKNKEALKKLSNLETILQNKELEKEKNPMAISNDTVVIVNDRNEDFVKKFKRLEDYCLNKEDIQILKTCTDLVLQSQKDNLNYIFKEIDNIKEILEDTEFMPVKFLSDTNRVQVRRTDNQKYTLISILIVSIFVSLFYIIILELYKLDRKKIK